MSGNQSVTFSERLKEIAVLSMIKVIGALPLDTARGLGAFVGQMAWLFKVREAKVTIKNIELCYPRLDQKEQQLLAKNSLKETGKLAAEIFVIRQRSLEWIKSKIFKTHGEEHILNAVAKGKGLIVLAPHLGNWEVLGQTLPSYAKLTVLYQPPKQAFLEKIVKRAREKNGATVVPTSRRGIVNLLNSLRSGGFTAVLPDQNPAQGSGDFAPFFGVPAYTMTIVHGFTKRSESAIVFAFVKRVKNGFETYYLKPEEAIYSEDVHSSLCALNKGVEECISYCPEQYQWEYKRFKLRPENMEDLY